MASLSIRYPIYIVSKGRANNHKTPKLFLRENIFFYIAVEPQEYENYCKTIPEKHVLKLPFSNLGLGSYPARNYCWEHSIQNGYKKHFLFDDNIQSFATLNNGKRKYNSSALDALVALENFTDKFKNVAISGYNYAGFVTKTTKKPFAINTHVYSGMLINNEIPYRWRLKYNEDVDLCLQALQASNQDELYKNNDPKLKFLKANALKQLWPQYVKVVKRFNRPHHYIDWRKHFTHPLRKVK